VTKFDVVISDGPDTETVVVSAVNWMVAKKEVAATLAASLPSAVILSVKKAA